MCVYHSNDPLLRDRLLICRVVVVEHETSRLAVSLLVVAPTKPGPTDPSRSCEISPRAVLFPMRDFVI